MKNNKLSLILYMIAAFIVLIPITIVLLTGIGFNSSYSKVFVNTAVSLIIAGRIFAVIRKAREDKVVPWAGIGGIIGLLIVLIWDIIR